MTQLFPFKVYTGEQLPAATAADIAVPWKTELMRRLTWVLLVAYALMLLRPAMPILADAMAHTLWKQQHMLTVHEVNGKFHVHYETQKAGNEQGKSKHDRGYKMAAADDVCLTAIAATRSTAINNDIQTHSVYHLQHIPLIHTKVTYPPPRA